MYYTNFLKWKHEMSTDKSLKLSCAACFTSITLVKVTNIHSDWWLTPLPHITLIFIKRAAKYLIILYRKCTIFEHWFVIWDKPTTVVQQQTECFLNMVINRVQAEGFISEIWERRSWNRESHLLSCLSEWDHVSIQYIITRRPF